MTGAAALLWAGSRLLVICSLLFRILIWCQCCADNYRDIVALFNLTLHGARKRYAANHSVRRLHWHSFCCSVCNSVNSFICSLLWLICHDMACAGLTNGLTFAIYCSGHMKIIIMVMMQFSHAKMKCGCKVFPGEICGTDVFISQTKDIPCYNGINWVITVGLWGGMGKNEDVNMVHFQPLRHTSVPSVPRDPDTAHHRLKRMTKIHYLKCSNYPGIIWRSTCILVSSHS